MTATPAAVEFKKLRVEDVARLTDDSVAVTFEVPETLEDLFAYLPGQHVVVKADIGGQDVRRSYSICANARSGILRVGIKRLAGGLFSTFATSQLMPGDVLEVSPPVGEFTIEPNPSAACHYAAIAAGSGITPVLSLISTTLEAEPASQWTLVFGNREARTVMFLDELEGLKDRYPARFQLVHVLSREPTLPLFSGRIDEERLHRLFDRLIDTTSVDRWFLCGPYDMVTNARTVLEGRGVAAADIRDELFFAGPLDRSRLPAPPADDEGSVALAFTLEGRISETRMYPETSVLDAALSVRTELPYSCKGGMCASCKARLVDGEVAMTKNYALVQSDLDSGFILTCQSHPTTDRVVVDFDQR